MLVLPDFGKPFDLACDASLVATGAELSQNGRPVAFHSKKLSPAETRYHVGDRELLAIFQACMKWRSYLHGNHCKVYTDHEPLIYVYTKPHLNARQARWLERMAELDLEILYRPGEKNVVADVLSRYGVEGTFETRGSARFSLGDSSVRRVVYEWLSVVAKHLDVDACVKGAVEALSRQLPIASFPCSKCGAIHGDLGKHARSLHTIHNCGVCGH